MNLMQLYMLKPKKHNIPPEPKEFFDKWTSFISEFKGKILRERSKNFPVILEQTNNYTNHISSCALAIYFILLKF